MKNNLSLAGVGPRIALITLPYLVLVMAVKMTYGEMLSLDFIPVRISNLAGYSWVTVGLIFYLATIVVFLQDFPDGKLVTRGPFSLCMNPIYGSFIVFFIPGLALIFQSGLLLTLDLVMYLNFRMAIHGEYISLQKRFGKEFEEYRQNVREIIPMPRFRK